MRADRLVAILLMLQRQGRVTAAEVAVELEVSERTARRDLDALGTAGLPVYSQQGRNGGWFLAGGGRTDLSGLNASEIRALFLTAGPALAVSSDLRAALRKLSRALPEHFRSAAESASTAVVVDPAGWDGSPRRRREPRWLTEVQSAVIDSSEIELGYVSRQGKDTTRVVHPLGLAVKGSAWYLLADTARGRRTFRVDRIRDVTPTGRIRDRPDDFDLEEVWKEVVGELNEQRTPLRARARVDPEAIDLLRWVLGGRMSIGPPTEDGSIEVELRGHTERSLAGEIAGFGASVEVLDPVGLRRHLATIGRELAAVYAA
jgi:predicted DNA-binding transcriptional regulator YafY